VEEVVAIPLPEKSGYITELWHHFDVINDLLLSARRGEDFFSAVKKLDRHKQVLRAYGRPRSHPVSQSR
jgi:hypothetical protein